MNIAIVEDSFLDLTHLYDDIKKISTNNNLFVNLTKYRSDNELFEKLPIIAMEVVFLVSDMKTFNVTEVAQKIHNLKPTCQIVFVTTSPDFASKKSCMSYINCILKPYSYADLLSVLNRLDGYCLKSSRYIRIKDMNEWSDILLSDILYVEHINHYVQVHTENNIMGTDLKFYEFVKILSPYKCFLQCNRFIIINMNKIRKVDESFFLITNGEYIPINKKLEELIKSSYTNYIFGVIEEDNVNVE